MDAKKQKIVYWSITGFLCFAMGASGITSLLHTPQNIEGMSHLGYPFYLMNILGIAKVLGVLALVTNKFPKIKEGLMPDSFLTLSGPLCP